MGLGVGHHAGPVDLGGGYANTTVTIPGGFWLASFGAFFVAIFLAVNPRRAALLGAVYAVLQGYCLGAISATFDAQTDGIVAAAILAPSQCSSSRCSCTSPVS